MAKMFKCDITGAVVDGEPIGKLDVQLGAELKAEVRIFRKHNGNYVQADMGPEAAEKITGVLTAIAPQAKKDAAAALNK